MRTLLFIVYAYVLIPCLAAIAQPAPKTPASQKIYNQFIKETRGLKDDTNKVLRYLAFAKALEPYSPDTVAALTKKARDISEKLHYQRGIELSIFEEGIHAESQRDYPLSTRYYGEAAKIAESNNFYADIY